MKVEKTICDRCGEEIKYQGWTAKLRFSNKKPFRLFITKIRNGNQSGYDYSEQQCELCNKCTLKLSVFLQGRELTDERSD